MREERWNDFFLSFSLGVGDARDRVEEGKEKSVESFCFRSFFIYLCNEEISSLFPSLFLKIGFLSSLAG